MILEESLVGSPLVQIVWQRLQVHPARWGVGPRASDFGLVAKLNTIRAKSKQASYAEMVVGSFVFLLV